jgi:hypothetical protein
MAPIGIERPSTYRQSKFRPRPTLIRSISSSRSQRRNGLAFPWFMASPASQAVTRGLLILAKLAHELTSSVCRRLVDRHSLAPK